MDRQIEPIIERNVELNQVIERLLGTLQDPQLYKNEIWTRVLRVTIDAPEQVEVHKIRESRFDVKKISISLQNARYAAHSASN